MAETSVGRDFSVLPFLKAPGHFHPGTCNPNYGRFPLGRGEELLAKAEPITGTLPSLLGSKAVTERSSALPLSHFSWPLGSSYFSFV